MFNGQQIIGGIEAATGSVLWNNVLKKLAKLTEKHLSLFLFLKKWQPGGFLLFSCYSFLRKIFMILIFDIWLNYFYVFECIFRIPLSTYANETHLYWLPYYSRQLLILQILICIVLIEIPAFSWILQTFQGSFKSLAVS